MNPMDRRVQIHEVFYLWLGAALCLALLVLGSWKPAALLVAAPCACYFMLLRHTARGSVARLLAAYAVTWAFYAGSSALVGWLGVPLQHETLEMLDTVLFGQMPADVIEHACSKWQFELLALGYMSYHAYLHWALLDSLRRGDPWRAALGERLFLAFGLGFVGYLVFPAAPPDAAFPGRFRDMISDGLFTQWNNYINSHMAARYDAFPSLHVLITATLLSWDWRHARWRFGVMLVPSLLMLVATLALRLHYAVDLLASAALFVILCLLHANRLTDHR